MTRGVRWSREQEARRATNATQRSKCAPPPLFRTSHSAFRILLFAQRKQVRKQAVRARNPGRELAEEREPGVDVHPLPHMAHQQAALERWIAGIVHLQKRGPRSCAKNTPRSWPQPCQSAGPISFGT